MTGDSGGRSLQTLVTAMEIVEFVKRENAVRAADIEREFGLAKSTTYGYVSTLEELGLLVRRDGADQLGLRFLQLGKHAKERDERYRLAKQKVESLADRLGEGADFMIEENGRLVSIYNRISSVGDPNFQVGRSFYLHNSAGGKAVLAELSPAEVDAALGEWGTPQTTGQTITDRGELRSEIEAVRERGYALFDEELMEG